MSQRSHRDLHEHIALLKERDLLWVIDEPVDKDAEMHPLVRWQFRGGIQSHQRKAFLFNHVVDGHGRKFEMPVVVGALAANESVYATGMDCDVEEIAGRWSHALANPIAPVIVDTAPCHEVVVMGDA